VINREAKRPQEKQCTVPPAPNAVDLSNKTEPQAQIRSRWCVEAPANPFVLRYRSMNGDSIIEL
jgi:hypothetical protein